MSRLKHQLPMESLKMIYNSLVLPHFYYAILVWGFDCERLNKLQKRAVRIIHSTKYNAHTEPLMRASNMLKIKDIFDTQCIKFIYRFNHRLLPTYFENVFQRNHEIHARATRRATDFYCFPVNRSRTKFCIRHYIPKLYNNLPSNIKEKFDTHSMESLSQHFKKWRINSYMLECQVANCYVCGRR